VVDAVQSHSIGFTIPAVLQVTLSMRNLMIQTLRLRLLVVGLNLAVIGVALLGLPGGRVAKAAEDDSQINTLTPYEVKAGWKLLFDGQTTKGWRNYKKESISDSWQVENGAITWTKPGAGDIVTTDEYDSFELSIEYNISEGGNSGIMFHVAEDEDAPWKTGPEVQVQDNVKGHDPQKSGWLYQLYQPQPDIWKTAPLDATRPAGQWNQVQLRVTPTVCEINVNGIRYALFQKGSDDWNERVAKSKFKAFKNFGKPTKGVIALQDHGNKVAYRNIKIRQIPINGSVPEPIDGTLPLKVEPAFAHVNWAGWDPVSDDGKPQSFRPIALTHAGDGSNRVFVATQQGAIYSFKNDQQAVDSQLLIDLRDRVTYTDRENEEGLLGFAFHPKFKENGQFFVYYTSSKAPPHTSVISRFTLKADSKTQGDPDSEEELLRIEQPFWNHNGGTLAFGPDGMLYIGMGDGGAANDLKQQAMEMSSLLGKILRIDVDHKDKGLNYAVPKDNPFVGKENVRPEIFAYGFRNIWRMSFDRETGHLWAADVGQNLWEEIDIVTKGGNYGWSKREGTHPFGATGSGPTSDLIEPVWEYDHQVGYSITGGHVYRGKLIPELTGKYVYADYVTGKIWALTYDETRKHVVKNEAIPTEKMPIISFGEDEQGEVYFTMVTASGKGIFRFTQK